MTTVTTTTARPKVRHRTIILPGNRAELIEQAARYHGVSGEKFIELAILEQIRSTFTRMLDVT